VNCENDLKADPTRSREEAAGQRNISRARAVAGSQGIPLAGTHFRRQAAIGAYVVDFFCPARRLIIELDGGHHNNDANAKRDRERQLWLEKEGYRVVRFWNSEIDGDLSAVLERIYVELYGSCDAEVTPLKHRRRG
jgi:very-short-patch-repair endonuclease